MNWNKAMIFHTVIWLKLLFTAICTIFLQTSLVTRASVVITWNTQTNMKKWKKRKKRRKKYASRKKFKRTVNPQEYTYLPGLSFL
jgi:ABC-type spermidine/putrescine transport system permease subunit I